MGELYLIIADQALRSALAEQVKLSAPEGMTVLEGNALPPRVTNSALAFILDAPQVDIKLLKSLGDRREVPQKLKIFLLGEDKQDELADLDNLFSVESFPKPFRLGHLLARLQFHFLAPRGRVAPIHFGPFRFEPNFRQIVIVESGVVIRLTEKETQLLDYLSCSAQPISREELLAAIWGYDARIDTHTLETHIYRLRRKLDPEGKDDSMLVSNQGAYALAVLRP